MIPLRENKKTAAKIRLNHTRNKKQDQTENIDAAATAFNYADCQNEYWNPERYSLMWGSPLWNESTESQRVVLNQLYWVAYYSQIISAEIATIFFNQTSAAGLYGVEDFRPVCDMLDLESSQERAHIAAFRTISDQVEQTLFGSRIFSYEMRTPYAETMIFPDSNALRLAWKKLQLRSFTLLSSANAFIACQYFTVRGIRTLNGKIVQHQLSQYYLEHPDKDRAPIPSKISYYHFLDESYHFNSSTIISHDVVRCLPDPTAFERQIVNMALRGCQKDHFNFSQIVNGIFWYDPSAFAAICKMLKSPVFGMGDKDAKEMIRRCFTAENDGLVAAHELHRTATESYRAYVADMDYVGQDNKRMALMSSSSMDSYLAASRKAFHRFAA